jgi:membrane-bound lytic murein transglycosylase D
MEKHLLMTLLTRLKHWGRAWSLWGICLLGLQACAQTSGGNPGLSLPERNSQGLNPPSTSPLSPDDMQPLAPVVLGSRTVTSLQPPADLWERIRRGFAMPDLESSLVQDNERMYSRSMLRLTERSRKYLFHVVEELERRNMPTELALLPFIESSYNPEAVSSAKAVGMWQFMPGTGKTFELKQNAFRDDRRDVLESTRAALDYLQKLYDMFGDWQLALAAYNWGEGSVSRAIARNKAAGLGLSYKDLNMPNETRLYVPRLQAVKNLIAAPEGFQAKLPLIENHPYFQSVPISRDIDVELAARLAEVSLEDFKSLNPSQQRPMIMAAGTPQILLPWDNAAIFQQNLETYAGKRLASWTTWVAPSTMKPAEAAQSVGMDEAEFRTINRIPPRMLLKAGSVLLVPRTDAQDSNVPTNLADNGQMALAPETVIKRSTIRARKGDTVASLALRYGVSAANLAEWNSLNASVALRKGQPVILLLPARVTADLEAAPTRARSLARSSRTGAASSASRPTKPSRATLGASAAEPASKPKTTPHTPKKPVSKAKH